MPIDRTVAGPKQAASLPFTGHKYLDGIDAEIQRQAIEKGQKQAAPKL